MNKLQNRKTTHSNRHDHTPQSGLNYHRHMDLQRDYAFMAENNTLNKLEKNRFNILQRNLPMDKRNQDSRKSCYT